MHHPLGVTEMGPSGFPISEASGSRRLSLTWGGRKLGAVESLCGAGRPGPTICSVRIGVVTLDYAHQISLIISIKWKEGQERRAMTMGQ